MNLEDFMFELFEYFQGKYADAVKDRIKAMAINFTNDERKAVFDHLIENQKASFKISVAEIVESCKFLGIGYHAAHYVPAVDWVCDACGHQFKYAQAVSDDDRIDRNLHDFCPRCGFQPTWTIVRRKYREQGGWRDEAEEVYQAHLDKASKREGLYFDRNKAERERRDQKLKAIDATVGDLGRAKRWDLDATGS